MAEETEANHEPYDSEEPDVLLDVPVVKVDEINLEVEDLRARVSLQAEVLELLKLNVGADVALGKVQLDIKGVDAQALLKVRLDNVAAIIERVLKTIDQNPQILEQVTSGVRSAVQNVSGGAGEAAGALGRSAGKAVESTGEGAGRAVESTGEGAGRAAEGAGDAAREVGGGAGQAVESAGQEAGHAAEGAAGGVGQATEGLGDGARQTVGETGEAARRSDLPDSSDGGDREGDGDDSPRRPARRSTGATRQGQARRREQPP